MSKFRKFIIYGSLAVFVLILAAVTIVWMGHREFLKQKAAYIAAGNTLDPIEFAPQPIPDDENAAVAYEAVFWTLTELTNDNQNLLNDVSIPGSTERQELLHQYTPVMDKIHAASRTRKCNWNIDYAQPVSMWYQGYLGSMRQSASLIRARVDEGANGYAGDNATGRADRDAMILADIETIIRMGLHIGENSTINGQVAMDSLLELGIEAYEEVYRDRPAPANGVATLFGSFDHRARYRRGLQAEAVMWNQNWNSVEAGQNATTIFSWDRAHYIQMLNEMVVTAKAPMYESAPSFSVPWYARTSDLILPAIERYERLLAKRQTNIEMLETAEQLRSYRDEHGSYPDPGVLDMPIDHTTGLAIGYTLTPAGGFILTGGTSGKNLIEWNWN